jgi:hypothetical protein
MRGVSPAKLPFSRIYWQYFRKSKFIRAKRERNIINEPAISTRRISRGSPNVQPHMGQYYTSIVGHMMLPACSSGENFRRASGRSVAALCGGCLEYARMAILRRRRAIRARKAEGRLGSGVTGNKENLQNAACAGGK